MAKTKPAPTTEENPTRVEGNKLVERKAKLLKQKDHLAMEIETKEAKALERGRKKLQMIDDSIDDNEKKAKEFFTKHRKDLVPRPNAQSVRLPAGVMAERKQLDKYHIPNSKDPEAQKLLVENIRNLAKLRLYNGFNMKLAEKLFTETKIEITKIRFNRKAIATLSSHDKADEIFSRLGITVTRGKKVFKVHPNKGDKAKAFAKDPKGKRR